MKNRLMAVAQSSGSSAVHCVRVVKTIDRYIPEQWNASVMALMWANLMQWLSCVAWLQPVASKTTAGPGAT